MAVEKEKKSSTFHGFYIVYNSSFYNINTNKSIKKYLTIFLSLIGFAMFYSVPQKNKYVFIKKQIT